MNATLTGDEARHASGARRLRPGDRVTLFNGHGLTAGAGTGRLWRARHDAGLARTGSPSTTCAPPRTAPRLRAAEGRSPGHPARHGCPTRHGQFHATAVRTQRGQTGSRAFERWRICLEAANKAGAPGFRQLLPAADPGTVAREAAGHDASGMDRAPRGTGAGCKNSSPVGEIGTF